MKISLVIPVYNEEKLIRQTLESISRAKFQYESIKENELEIIIVDNASTDSSVEICKEFDVKIVTESIHNIAKVRNTGANFATGEIICFLDADSEISANIFLLIKERMCKDTYVGGGTKFKLDKRSLMYRCINVSSVFVTHILGISGVLIYVRKKDFEQLGGFNERYLAGEDIDFVIKMKKYGKACNKKYSNIYGGYVVTSSRKFKTLKLKDLVMQGGLLLHKSLRENPQKCKQWYNINEYR